MMEVADAHKSVATIHTVVSGHEAHSALPALGANAIAAAADIVSEIGRLAREYEKGPLDPRFAPPYSTLHVGLIHGGTARNILARECAFDWEFRGLPGASAAAPVAEVQAFVDTVALPRLTRFVSRSDDRDRYRGRRAGARRRARLAGRDAGAAADPVQPDDRRVLRHGVRPFPAGRVCRPSSAGRDRSIRRTSPTNTSRRRNSRPASRFWTISRASWRGSGATSLSGGAAERASRRTRQKSPPRAGTSFETRRLRRRSSGRFS